MSKGVKDVTTQEVIDMLKDGPHEVIFEKLDGTVRQMTATLNQDFLQTYNPVSVSDVVREDKKDGKDIKALAVFEICDTGDHQWRSFRLDKLMQIGVQKVNYVGN